MFILATVLPWENTIAAKATFVLKYKSLVKRQRLLKGAQSSFTHKLIQAKYSSSRSERRNRFNQCIAVKNNSLPGTRNAGEQEKGGTKTLTFLREIDHP